jgi:hypothetical protein
MNHYKKKDIHEALANKFNYKKTISNDLNRINSFYQTNKMINQKMTINVKKEFFIEEDLVVEKLYNMEFDKPSAQVNLNLINEDESKIIPKILYKEIIIPTHTEQENFDFTTIHKNINQKIVMDSNMDSTNIDEIINSGIDSGIEKLHKKYVKIINNVYQEIYTDEKKPTGFGDFIRGCYFLLQFCRKYDFVPNIIVNHPISLFLEKYYKNYHMNQFINKNIFSFIPMFVDSNWKNSEIDANGYITDVITSKKTLNEIINYFCTLSVNKNNIFVYNILFPYDQVDEKDKMFMRDILEPNNEMKYFLQENMNTLCITKKKYSIIHIRSGDIYLSNESKLFNSDYFVKICSEVFQIINNNYTMDYLLIADNNEIKYLLCEIYTNIKSVYKEITHVGEGNVLERNKIKNTLLDFYLMSNSNSIHSFTSYEHGSGFSLWCATTYNIPYTCKYIKNSN